MALLHGESAEVVRGDLPRTLLRGERPDDDGVLARALLLGDAISVGVPFTGAFSSFRPDMKYDSTLPLPGS